MYREDTKAAAERELEVWANSKAEEQAYWDAREDEAERIHGFYPPVDLFDLYEGAQRRWDYMESHGEKYDLDETVIR